MPKNSDLLQSGAKIILLANSLQEKEWQGFEEFIGSPFFNKDTRLIELYHILNRFYPFQKSLYKTDLLPILGIQASYSIDYVLSNKEDGLLRKLLTIFCRLIEQYIVHLELREQPFNEQRLLADFLLKRKAYRLIPSLVRSNKLAYKGENNYDYYHRYLAEEHLFYLHILKRDLVKNDNLQVVIGNLTQYTLSTLLLYYCAAVNRERILNVQYEYSLIEHVIDHIEEELSIHSPLVQVYYHISKLLNHQDTHLHFSEALTIYHQNQSTFDKTTQRQISNYLLNCCSQQIRRGNFNYRLKKHALYITGIEHELFNTDLYFSSYHFYLIVQNACKLKKDNWVIQFIDTYQQQLAPQNSAQIYRLSMGHYFFTQENYTEALKQLNQLDTSKDFFYTIYYKVLSIQIYYEHYPVHFDNKQHPIDAALQALRQYLNRDKKMSDRIRNSYKNFMRFCERLNRIRMKKKDHLLNRLEADIKEEEHVDERDWLLQKINSDSN